MSAPDDSLPAKGGSVAPPAGSRPRASATATVAGPLTVRVTVSDAWRTFAFQATVAESAASLKAKALASAHVDPAHAARYEMKIGGALVRDESRPIGGLGIKDGTPLVVLPSRRRPVR